MGSPQENDSDDGDIIIIKKYANRRLYNTDTSKYITLDFLAQLTREQRDFKVIDAKSGEDITHNVLTQIIMDEEANGQNLLPVNFLKQLIAMYDSGMRSMVPEFLENSMSQFSANSSHLRDSWEKAVTANPLAEMARQNMKIMQSLTPGFTPPEQGDTESGPDDIESLKRQMAELQAKIDAASKD